MKVNSRSPKYAYWFSPKGVAYPIHGTHASMFNGNRGEGWENYGREKWCPLLEGARQALESGWIRVRCYNFGWHIQTNDNTSEALEKCFRFLFEKHPSKRDFEVIMVGLHEGYYGDDEDSSEWDVRGEYRFRNMYEAALG